MRFFSSPLCIACHGWRVYHGLCAHQIPYRSLSHTNTNHMRAIFSTEVRLRIVIIENFAPAAQLFCCSAVLNNSGKERETSTRLAIGVRVTSICMHTSTGYRFGRIRCIARCQKNKNSLYEWNDLNQTRCGGGGTSVGVVIALDFSFQCRCSCCCSCWTWCMRDVHFGVKEIWGAYHDPEMNGN